MCGAPPVRFVDVFRLRSCFTRGSKATLRSSSSSSLYWAETSPSDRGEMSSAAASRPARRLQDSPVSRTNSMSSRLPRAPSLSSSTNLKSASASADEQPASRAQQSRNAASVPSSKSSGSASSSSRRSNPFFDPDGRARWHNARRRRHAARPRRFRCVADPGSLSLKRCRSFASQRRGAAFSKAPIGTRAPSADRRNFCTRPSYSSSLRAHDAPDRRDASSASSSSSSSSDRLALRPSPTRSSMYSQTSS
mmetsp:Transcript_23357/g.65474  ORF Transcript_23357/g.65474 Transcript_23357/m.65474 type:complete len:250 (+) Transcript_23357:497-1246(+)